MPIIEFGATAPDFNAVINIIRPECRYVCPPLTGRINILRIIKDLTPPYSARALRILVATISSWITTIGTYTECSVREQMHEQVAYPGE